MEVDTNTRRGSAGKVVLFVILLACAVAAYVVISVIPNAPF